MLLFLDIMIKKNRRKFRKKRLSFVIVEETNKMFQGKGGRSAKLFRFNKYKEYGFQCEIKLA